MSKELFFQKGNNKRYLSADANTWGAATATQYKFNQDYAASTFNSSNPTQPLTKIFKNGDTIMGVLIKGDSTPNGIVAPRPDVIQTTFDGKAPDFNMVGQAWFSIPTDKLTSGGSSTGQSKNWFDNIFQSNPIDTREQKGLLTGNTPKLQPIVSGARDSTLDSKGNALPMTKSIQYVLTQDYTTGQQAQSNSNPQPIDWNKIWSQKGNGGEFGYGTSHTMEMNTPLFPQRTFKKGETVASAPEMIVESFAYIPPTKITVNGTNYTIPLSVLQPVGISNNNSPASTTPLPTTLLTPTNMFIAAVFVIGIFIIIK